MIRHEWSDNARAMTREEWKALRQTYRDQRAADGRVQRLRAERDAWRFLGFTIAATLVALIVTLVRG